jgi:oligopeptide/dipeptide ABC transporter ATP-binding protein
MPEELWKFHERNFIDKPLHPYTKLLMLSIPDAHRRGQRLATIPGRVRMQMRHHLDAHFIHGVLG